MKKGKLFQFFATVLALAFVGCSHDTLTGDDSEGDQNGSKDAVYMNVTVQLPVAGGMGSRSKTDTGKDDDYGTSTSGTEVGKDNENTVYTVLLVLAEKGTNKLIACGTQDGFASLSQDGKKVNTVQSIEKSALSSYYKADGTLDEGKEEINVYVFCNPTSNLQTTLKGKIGKTDWIDEIAAVEEEVDPHAFGTGDGEAIWGGSKHEDGFLMATAQQNDIVKTIPSKLSTWDRHNSAEKAFDLTGKNYSGTDDEIDNGNGGKNVAINVERAVARFDFKDGSPLAPASPYTYNVVKDEETGNTVIQIELTKMALVNMSKEFYYLRRVSADGKNTSAIIGGVETGSNYVVDTDADFKATADLKTVSNTKFAEHFNFCFGDAKEGGKWTINENARNQWYTSDISTVLAGEEDNPSWTGAAGYRIWRYVTENTIPGNNEQKHGISTGIVFKGKMIVPEAFEEDEHYKNLYNIINNADSKLTGDPDYDPILYAHSSILYVTWREVRAVAIKNQGKNPMFYKIVFGTPEAGKEPVAESGEKGEEGYVSPVYSTDEQSPDYWWARWQDTPGLSDEEKGNARVKFKEIATSENAKFTLYQSSTEEDSEGVEHKGYYCYYYYWNRHNDNGDATNMGTMEFGVVRNNVYKLAVTQINELGHPRLSENDPDPEDPDKPDETGKIYFKLSVEVLPWVVRVNNIEF